MATTTIDAEVLKKLFLAGAANLEAKKEWINDLNVFPVPDGDTGTNMTLTIMSAAKEVNSLAAPTMQTLSKAISGGSLRGARGNSGVILSQLLRGFTKVVRDYDELDSIIISTAFQKAVETAYKAVMKPKEGTILTVARGMADKILDLSTEIDDLEELLDKVIKYGDEVLEHTPDLLPVLKQAGVVDSGGQGLMQIMKGAYDALMGKEINYEAVASQGGPSGSSEVSAQGLEEKEIKFGYCTEFIVMLEKPYDAAKEAEFKAYLESIGDSIVLVSDGEIVKVHVHTNHPGLAFEKGLTFGSLTRMKVDNMREEHQEKLIKALAATGKPLVIVYIAGRPLNMNLASEVGDALLMAWYPGEQGGNGIADVLFGDYNPSGRLPMSVPRNVGQLPVHYSQGVQRDYMDGPGTPLYAFGYGLSYTTFAYSNLKLTPGDGKDVLQKVTCTVTNTGNRDGVEIAQLYINDEVSSVVTPPIRLKGFRRIELKKGESREVTFELTAKDLSIYDRNMNFVVEPGKFNVMVGSASDNLPLKASFEIK